MIRAARLLSLSHWALPSSSCAFATQPLTDYALTVKKASEIGEVGHVQPEKAEIGLCAGIPMETYKRPARIFVPGRSSSQQGMGKTLHDSAKGPQWRIAFDSTGKWENHLMGWTSTADPLENLGRTTLVFYTKEEAAAFCDKHGWEYSVDMPNVRTTVRAKRINSYGDNFSTKRGGTPDLTHLETRTTY